MARCNAILFVILGATAVGRPLAADQWTRFRGPNGSGVGEGAGIAVVWTEKDYRWRVEVPGICHSSPVVWKDRIFTTSADQDDATRRIRCLNTSNGQVLWQRTFPSTPFTLNNATAFDTASPTVDEERVYMTWCTPEQYTVVALDIERGDEVWRCELPGPFEGDHNFGSSPILFRDLLILQNDQAATSFVLALDRRTGDTRWKTDRPQVKTSYCTPLIYQTESPTPQLILGCSARGLSSLDPLTGKLHWELTDLFGDLRIVGSPAVAAGLVFTQCGSGGGGKRMYAVRPGDPQTGENPAIAYELTGSLPYVPTPIARGNLLFFISDGGVATCIDAPTGDLLWRERVGGNYFSSPVRVADRIYCVSRAGEVAVLAAEKQFKLLGQVDLGEPSHSTPAVSGGVMYLRTFSHLMAVGTK